MKTIRFFAIMLTACLSLGTVACDKEKEKEPVPPEDTTLAVDLTPLVFVAEGETKTIAVTSELDWTAVSSELWLTVTPNAEKTEFTATATANDGDVRTATITVDNGADTPKVIEVTQAKSADYVTFIGAVGMNFGPNWLNEQAGEFYLEAWSFPVNSFGQPTDEGYKIDGISVYSALSEAMDVVDLAPGEYTVVEETNTVELMTIPSATNMRATVTYAAPGATTTESLKLVGGTMKVEGTVESHTITFDFELQNAAGETRPLKGKFTGAIGLKVW